MFLRNALFANFLVIDMNFSRHGLKLIPKSQHAGVRCLLVTCGDWDLRQMLPAQCKLHGEPWSVLNVSFARLQPRPGLGLPGDPKTYRLKSSAF